MMRIVLDTNCLIASLSRTSTSYDVWKGLHEGKYILCVSTDILNEYQEIIEQKTTPEIAENVIQYLINSEFVEFITPYYHFDMIVGDRDDNKFADCAFAANAMFIVSEDRHYKVLERIAFPRLFVIRLMQFVQILKSQP